MTARQVYSYKITKNGNEYAKDESSKTYSLPFFVYYFLQRVRYGQENPNHIQF